MMTSLLDILVRFRRTCAFAALLVLAGCGPGTGGTGTGPSAAIASFSGDALQSTAEFPGVRGPGCSNCARANLRLEEGLVELMVPCGRFIHSGPWDSEALETQVIGSLEATSASGSVTVPAVLHLQFSQSSATSPQVIVTLTNEARELLAGPLQLQRDEGVPTSAVCTP
jgi:hypothetical protein